MVASNEFLPMSAAGGANVQSQVDYSGSASQLTGFIAGIAQSAIANKVWRQATVPGSQLAEAMAQVLSTAIVDDGNTDAFLSQLLQTFAAQGFYADGGTANHLSIAAPFGLAFPAPVAGTTIRVKAANANTGPTDFNYMGNGAIAVHYANGTALAGNDWSIGSVLLLTFDGTFWQFISAITSGSRLAHGECYLQYVSNTQIQLVPKNGCNIISGGTQYQIASAGITLTGNNNTATINGVANQNVAASTTYWVVFNGLTGTLQLRTSGTASHGPDTTAGNIGIEVTTIGGTPQTHETLVGWAITNGAGAFQVQGTGTFSWFNADSFLSQGTQIYSSAGSFTFVVPFPDLYIEGWGGGGGGSGNLAGQFGDGGGGGGYGAVTLKGLTVGSSVTVTVAAAAAGGANTGQDGGNGGTCSFGAFLTCPGGGGGAHNSASGGGGASPGSGTGVFGISGQTGSAGIVVATIPVEQGGDAPRGGGGGISTVGGGEGGRWPGGGGGCGMNSSANEPGGAGAVGGFVIRW